MKSEWVGLDQKEKELIRYLCLSCKTVYLGDEQCPRCEAVDSQTWDVAVASLYPEVKTATFWIDEGSFTYVSDDENEFAEYEEGLREQALAEQIEDDEIDEERFERVEEESSSYSCINVHLEITKGIGKFDAVRCPECGQDVYRP